MIFDGKKNGWAFMTIHVDGDDCAFNYPLEPKESLLAREDEFKLALLSDMYPDAVYLRAEDETELQAFERWIAEGCIVQTGDPLVPEVVIQKIPITRQHPTDLDDFDKTDEQIAAMEELKKTDADMARIGEDLIQVLISKGVLTNEDFHGSVVEKINKRADLRKKI